MGMIGAVDVGGTKTLVASFTDDGKLIEEERFESSPDYKQFLADLRGAVAKLTTKDFTLTGVAIPGIVDRINGFGINLPNLDWKHVPIQADLEVIFGSPIRVENDAKAGGLAEAKAAPKYKKVLYVTIGTGIGIALIVDGKISEATSDTGGYDFMLDYGGKHVSWEHLASGKAIVKRFGKKAEDIHDAKTWQEIVKLFALGLVDLNAIFTPDVIIIGGGVGKYFERFGKYLIAELKNYATPLTQIPPIKEAKHPEEAVIYGCYELAKQQLKANG